MNPAEEFLSAGDAIAGPEVVVASPVTPPSPWSEITSMSPAECASDEYDELAEEPIKGAGAVSCSADSTQGQDKGASRKGKDGKGFVFPKQKGKGKDKGASCKGKDGKDGKVGAPARKRRGGTRQAEFAALYGRLNDPRWKGKGGAKSSSPTLLRFGA